MRTLLVSLSLFLTACQLYSETHVHVHMREGPVAQIDCATYSFMQIGSSGANTYWPGGISTESQDPNTALSLRQQVCSEANGGRQSASSADATKTILQAAFATLGGYLGGLIAK